MEIIWIGASMMILGVILTVTFVAGAIVGGILLILLEIVKELKKYD